MGEQAFLPKMAEAATDKLFEDKERDQRLDDYNLQVAKEKNVKVLKAMVTIYLETLSFAKHYQEKHQHRIYFTPAYFLQNLNNYHRLMKDRQENVLNIKNRYIKGLERIKDTILAINKYYQELDVAIPQLIETQKQLVAIIVDIQS